MARLSSSDSARSVDFRPHLKTVKSRDVAKICAQKFGERAMVSSLLEIEKLQDCGLSDFLYSIAIVPSKFPRVARLLSDNCFITVTVDSPEVAASLAAFCRNNNVKINAVIELDLDGHRSGVRPDDHEKLCEIGKFLDDADILRGVMSHAGESYNLSEVSALQACALNEAEQTLYAANILRQAGMRCELVTIGSTPTAFSGSEHKGITELRAGVFMFFDLVQAGVGVCGLDEIALSVLTSVISVNRDTGTIIVDAGWMALSRDRGTANQAIDYGYGQVCREDGTVLPDVIVSDVQQEHGIIKLRKDSKEKLPDVTPGSLLRILPNHACATAAAHDCYNVITQENEVTEKWPRFSGW